MSKILHAAEPKIRFAIAVNWLRLISLCALLAAWNLAVWAGQNTPANARIAVIGPDDSVTIQVLGCEDLNKVWRVSASGALDLPLVGTIQAGGLSVEDLRKELSSRLSKFVIDPQVTVFVSEFRSGPVVVAGAVQQPGTFQMEGSKTLLNMLVRAGGSKDAGATVNLRRDLQFGPIPSSAARVTEDGRYSTIELRREDVEAGNPGAADIEIRPYDVISVPANKARNVYIVGEVNRPGVVEVVSKDHIPLLVLVAMAGGLTKGAAPGNLRILGDHPNGTRTATQINLKHIMTGKIQDVEVSPGDIVVVPTSKASYLSGMAMTMATAGVSSGMLILGRF